MSDFQSILSDFVLLWAVIDPIGTIPVFIAATRNRPSADRQRIALRASATAASILLFFIVIGEAVLNAMGVPLLAFQISGGI
jgi:multiple antibiotic resistance protein